MSPCSSDAERCLQSDGLLSQVRVLSHVSDSALFKNIIIFRSSSSTMASCLTPRRLTWWAGGNQSSQAAQKNDHVQQSSILPSSNVRVVCEIRSVQRGGLLSVFVPKRDGTGRNVWHLPRTAARTRTVVRPQSVRPQHDPRDPARAGPQRRCSITRANDLMSALDAMLCNCETLIPPIAKTLAALIMSARISPRPTMCACPLGGRKFFRKSSVH